MQQKVKKILPSLSKKGCSQVTYRQLIKSVQNYQSKSKGFVMGEATSAIISALTSSLMKTIDQRPKTLTGRKIQSPSTASNVTILYLKSCFHRDEVLCQYCPVLTVSIAMEEVTLTQPVSL